MWLVSASRWLSGTICQLIHHFLFILFVKTTQLLEPIFAHLRKAAETKTLLDQFIPHLRALALLTKERPIAKAVRSSVNTPDKQFPSGTLKYYYR